MKGNEEHGETVYRQCEVCQRSKYENLYTVGLLHPLPIPCQALEEISMDFIEGLSKSGGKTTILVVVDIANQICSFLLSFPPLPSQNSGSYLH